MTLTLLLLIFIFIAFFSVLTIIFVTVKGSFPNGPTYNLLSFAFFTNWILYLSTFYALLPEKISEFLFLPIWFSFVF